MLQSIQANMNMVQRQWTMVNAQQDTPNKTSALQYLTTQMQRLMSMHESVLNASRNSVTPDSNASGSSMNAPPLNQTANPLAPTHPPGEPRSWDPATTAPHSYPLSVNQIAQPEQKHTADSVALAQPSDPSFVAPSNVQTKPMVSPVVSTPAVPSTQSPPQPSNAVPRDFLSAVYLFYSQRGMILAPDFASPFVGPATTPNETRSIDLQRLFTKVLSMGGSDHIFSVQNGWALVAQQLDLAVGPPTSSTPPSAIPTPGEVPARLAAYYVRRLLPFEKSWIATQRAHSEASKPAIPTPPTSVPAPTELPTAPVQTSAPVPVPVPTPTPTAATASNPFINMEPTQVQMVVGQHLNQLQNLVAAGQLSPQLAMARYAATQQALQAYNNERAASLQRPTEPGPVAPTPAAAPKVAKPTANLAPPVPVPPPAQVPAPEAPSTVERPPETDSPKPIDSPKPSQPPREVLTRYEIEYIPTNIRLSTFGGRDLNRLDEELAPRLAQCAGTRGVHELGVVDVHALIMSLKSGLAVEISYALNALLIVSAGADAPSDFQLSLAQCDDLLDVLLDVLASHAPCDSDTSLDHLLQDSLLTYCDAIDLALAEEAEICVRRRQSKTQSEEHEADRRVAVAQVVLTILRNLSVMPENCTYLATHKRFIPMMASLLRTIQRDQRWDTAHGTALAAFSLRELLHIRKDVLTMMLGVAGEALELRRFAVDTIAALVDLLRFFVLDAVEFEQRYGTSSDALERASSSALVFHAPHHIFLALQALSLLTLPDANRDVLAYCIPLSVQIQLVSRLITLLPISVSDFRRFASLTRLEYTETAAICLYNLIYLAPLAVKTAIRDTLGVPGILFRAVKHLIMSTRDYAQNPYDVLCRRLIETAHLLIDDKDSLDESPLLGMYWPPTDEKDHTKSSEQTTILTGHDETVIDMLIRTSNVDAGMTSELLALV